MSGSHALFAKRVLIAIALLAGALLVWELRSVLLLLFAAVMAAVVLHAAADGLCKLIPMPRGLAMLVGGLSIVALLVGAGFLFGREVSSQLTQLGETLPEAWETFVEWAGPERVESVLQDFAPDGAGVASVVQAIFGALSGAVSGLVIALLGGIYLAINPGLYRRGAIRLLPHAAQDRVDHAAKLTGKALRNWLLAQLLSMAATFVVVYIGLTLIGVPSALALAILAGLFEFVPLVGPLLGAIPAVLIAMVSGFETLAWTIAFFVVWQQIEGNAIAPLAMKYAVEIPPATTLFCLFVFGALFGLPGLLLGGPLTVLVWMAVKTLWLGEEEVEGVSE